MRASFALILIATVLSGTVSATIAAADTAAGGCVPQRLRVVIDIGHSINQPGAISSRGVGEFTFNRELAREIAERLKRQGFARTSLLNEAGETLSLAARVGRINRESPDLVLSIHHDSVQPQYLSSWTPAGQPQTYSDRFQGFSLFVSGDNRFPQVSRALASRLGQELTRRGLTPSLHHAEDIPGERRRLLEPARGVYAFDGLAVLRGADAPAVLIEAGVIKHRDEELRVATPGFRQTVADAVAAAVTAFCRG